MSTTIARELAALDRMTVGELHNRYAEVFGEQARSRHKQYLVRRIAWRIQANAEGGLSERALRRAEELADIRDVRVTPPRAASTPRQVRQAAPTPRSPLDRRLPAVGAAITRKYRGQTISVTVLADGFEHAAEAVERVSMPVLACCLMPNHWHLVPPLREDTERPVTITQGTNRLVGTAPAAILEAYHACRNTRLSTTPTSEKWDGQAAQRIAAILARQ